MRTWVFAFLCVLMSLATQAEPMAIEPYGELPSMEMATLSPDGKQLAFLRTVKQERVLMVISLEQNALLTAIRTGELKIRRLFWADEQFLLFTTASTHMPEGLQGERTEWNTIQALDLKTGKMWPLLAQKQRNVVTMNVTYGRPIVRSSDEGPLVYLSGMTVEGVTTPALYRVNLRSRDERIERRGSLGTLGWTLDARGELLADEEYSESDRRWRIHIHAAGHPTREVTGIAAVDLPHIMAVSADRTSLIVSMPTGSNGTVWKRLKIDDGSWGEDLSIREAASAIVYDPADETMIGTASIRDTTSYHFLDPVLQGYWDWVQRVFYDEHVTLMDLSRDHARALVQVLGPRAGYGYYVVDFAGHTSRFVGQVHEGIKRIADVSRVDYTASDGLHIEAYLTLPPDRPVESLPLVVMPHGGPQAADMLTFDWWAQALAAQGYAVLQPNYRGSALSQRFVEAGYGQWGRKMQTDLSDGVAALAARKVIDPSRVCIVGASYGGYAALAGVALQTGIYRCAVAVAGVSDPAEMLRTAHRKGLYGDRIEQRYWNRFLGVEGPEDSALRDISPLLHADRIDVPVLLIHGREDTVVPYEQSAAMARALQKAGKPAELITLDKEDHYLSRTETRLRMLQATVTFLRAHNPSQ